MANNRISIGLKVSAVLFTLAVGVYAIMIWLRPEASVARVKAGMATSAVSGSVLVQAEDPLELRTETGGKVAESMLDLDKRVKADDVLFKMDTGDILLEIEKIQNDYVAAKKQLGVGSAAEVELENAKEKLSNAEREFKRGTVSEADITRIKREIRSIEQRLALESINRTQNMQSLDNQLKSRKRALEKMTIRAPFDGIIAQVYPNTRKGALLGGGTPIARLTTGKNRIEARISEENIAGVKVGQKALVQFLPYDIQQFDAKVIKVLTTVDLETQRYIVHLEVDIDPAKVIPGIQGEVSITLRSILQRPS